MRLAGNKIRRHTRKRDGKIIKALEFGVWKEHFVKNQRDLLTCIEASRKLQALAQAEFETARDFMSVLFASKGEILERCLHLSVLRPNRFRLVISFTSAGDLPVA